MAIPAAPGAISHCHEMIAETAKALAHEVYDALMQDQVSWKAWRGQNPGLGRKALEARFVAKYWGQSIPAARATLAAMLTGSLPDHLKDQIKDALILDATLISQRRDPVQAVAAIAPRSH
jgi:hypothetical protein